MTLKSVAKLEKKLTCGLESDMWNWTKFYQSTQNPHPLLWDPFIQSRKCMSLEFTKLCVMTMKNDAKFEEQLTCCFKIGIRNLTNFDPNA